MNSYYVDVHAHLSDKDYADDRQQVIQRAVASGLGAIVVNGTEPASNRAVLALADEFAIVKPALGIYPVYAALHKVANQAPYALEPFDLDEEISFIRTQALANKIIAVGECGLDGHWLPGEALPYQEEVFSQLIAIAHAADLPIIVHTRKLESRAMEMLAAAQIAKVVFHCFSGKANLAINGAEKHGWHFSIPANAARHEGFQKLLKKLPAEALLTETDSPWLAPQPGTRNEPMNVVGTVALLAKLRGLEVEAAQELVWKNYQRVFNKNFAK